MKQLTAIHEAINAQEQSRGPRGGRGNTWRYSTWSLSILTVFRRRWNEPRREGPYTVCKMQPQTAVQVEGSTTWYFSKLFL